MDRGDEIRILPSVAPGQPRGPGPGKTAICLFCKQTRPLLTWLQPGTGPCSECTATGVDDHPLTIFRETGVVWSAPKPAMPAPVTQQRGRGSPFSATVRAQGWSRINYASPLTDSSAPSGLDDGEIEGGSDYNSRRFTLTQTPNYTSRIRPAPRNRTRPDTQVEQDERGDLIQRSQNIAAPSLILVDDPTATAQPSRKRGRPRKNPLPSERRPALKNSIDPELIAAVAKLTQARQSLDPTVRAMIEAAPGSMNPVATAQTALSESPGLRVISDDEVALEEPGTTENSDEEPVVTPLRCRGRGRPRRTITTHEGDSLPPVDSNKGVEDAYSKTGRPKRSTRMPPRFR